MMSALVLALALSLAIVASPPSGPDAPPLPASQESPAATPQRAGGGQATVALEQGGRFASGAVISEVGLVLTTADVVSGSEAISTVFENGRRLPTRLLYADPVRGLALLRIDSPGPCASLPLADRVPEAGGTVQVIWHPGGLAWTSSSGAVSSPFALHDGKLDNDLFRVRLTPLAHAHGAPVLDAQGRLVGLANDAAADGENPSISIGSIRAFLDQAGVYAPDFSLSLTTVPPGAAAWVDGRAAGDTASPLVIDRLTLGRHEVRLQEPGEPEDVVSVELVQRANTLLVRRLDAWGQVELSANARAEAWIDGSYRGVVPLLLSLPAGPHTVAMRARGFLTAAEAFDVSAGQRTAKTIALVAVYATLSLETIPEGAEVAANGEPLGVTPLSKVRVPAGQVELSIAHPGTHAYRFAVALAPREERDLGSYRLEAPYGWLVPDLPGGSLIAVDAGPRHPPARYERLPVGGHRVAIYAPHYYAYSEQVAVGDAQTVAFSPPLALYDRLAPRKVAGLALGGTGLGLGLVSLGMIADSTTQKWSVPVGLGSLAAIGAAAFFLATAPASEEAGWAVERGWSGPGSVAP